MQNGPIEALTKEGMNSLKYFFNCILHFDTP